MVSKVCPTNPREALGLDPEAVHISDATLSVIQVADIIHRVSQADPQAALQGLESVGEDWI